MLSNLEKAVLDRLVGGTNGLVDRKSQVIAMNWGRNNPDEVLRIILDKREAYLNRLCINQRRWQSQTKNKNKCRHSDSLALREYYVRGHCGR